MVIEHSKNYVTKADNTKFLRDRNVVSEALPPSDRYSRKINGRIDNHEFNDTKIYEITRTGSRHGLSYELIELLHQNDENGQVLFRNRNTNEIFFIPVSEALNFRSISPNNTFRIKDFKLRNENRLVYLNKPRI